MADKNPCVACGCSNPEPSVRASVGTGNGTVLVVPRDVHAACVKCAEILLLLAKECVKCETTMEPLMHKDGNGNFVLAKDRGNQVYICPACTPDERFLEFDMCSLNKEILRKLGYKIPE